MINHKNYSESKIIKFPNKQRQQQPIISIILRLTKISLHYLVVLFTKKNELQIRQQVDRFGNMWWNAYDPVTGGSQRFFTQAEMLTWIEKYYCR
jgi:hypothetical protein